MRGYPPWFPRVLFAVVAATLVTGVLLVPSALFYRLDWEAPWKLGGGPRNLVGALHVVTGFALAAVFGAVWAVHVRHNWKLRLNRRSGSSVIAALTFLTLSGIGSMYLGGEHTAPLNSVAHILLGLAAPICLVFHALRGRRLALTPKAER